MLFTLGYLVIKLTHSLSHLSSHTRFRTHLAGGFAGYQDL